MTEEVLPMPHKLTLLDRKSLSISGYAPDDSQQGSQ